MSDSMLDILNQLKKDWGSVQNSIDKFNISLEKLIGNSVQVNMETPFPTSDNPNSNLEQYLIDAREDSYTFKIALIFKEINRPMTSKQVKKSYRESKMHNGREPKNIINKNIQGSLSYLRKKGILDYDKDNKLYSLKK